MFSLYDQRGQRKYVTITEREAYLDAVRQNALGDISTFCPTLAYTGTRISEALQMTPRRVDFGVSAFVVRRLSRLIGIVTEGGQCRMNTLSDCYRVVRRGCRSIESDTTDASLADTSAVGTPSNKDVLSRDACTGVHFLPSRLRSQGLLSPASVADPHVHRKSEVRLCV